MRTSPAKVTVPVIGPLNVQQHLHQGAFSGTVSGDQGRLLSRGPAKMEVLKNEAFAKTLCQPLYRKHIAACHAAKVAGEAG